MRPNKIDSEGPGFANHPDDKLGTMALNSAASAPGSIPLPPPPPMFQPESATAVAPIAAESVSKPMMKIQVVWSRTLIL